MKRLGRAATAWSPTPCWTSRSRSTRSAPCSTPSFLRAERAVAAFNFVWTSTYQDSVTLMRLTGDLEGVSGVTRAAVMMGTPQNRALLADAGLLTTVGKAATPTDLIIAIVADDEAAARAAEHAARAALTSRPADGRRGRLPRPRTLPSALRALPGANLALISVPGLYAAAEAQRALRAGLHVLLFSDNVSIEQEVELKRLARELGLLLMGPDCG